MGWEPAWPTDLLGAIRPAQSLAVLCDFDSTISDCDTVELLYEAFAGPSCRALNRRWLRREISTQQELEGCFGTIVAGKDEMEAVLARVGIDPNFPAFVEFCRQKDYPLAVVSDGLDWIIDFVLARHGLAGLKIYCNRARFEVGGLRFEYPHFDPAAPLRGVSKPTIIRRYQTRGHRVAFIGDGPSDLEALRVADVVYAKGWLLQHCLRNGFAVRGFRSFGDLLKKWNSQGASDLRAAR